MIFYRKHESLPLRTVTNLNIQTSLGLNFSQLIRIQSISSQPDKIIDKSAKNRTKMTMGFWNNICLG